jgi:hypothetical protein
MICRPALLNGKTNQKDVEKTVVIKYNYHNKKTEEGSLSAAGYEGKVIKLDKFQHRFGAAYGGLPLFGHCAVARYKNH